MLITIRKAILEDIPWILEELKKFSKFYETKNNLFPSESHASVKLGELIEGHVAFIAEEEVLKMGFIIGVHNQHFFNPALTVLTEIFWWVKEEYRGTRAGYMLLDNFINYGKVHADWVVMTLEEKSPVKDKILLKKGFHLHERSYLLEN